MEIISYNDIHCLGYFGTFDFTKLIMGYSLLNEKVHTGVLFNDGGFIWMISGCGFIFENLC